MSLDPTSAGAASARTRLGFLGGSFDPPHRGHVAIARAAAAAFHLHRILFVPTARQPLKAAGAAASYADRLGMVQALCATAPTAFEASSLEAPRASGEPNFTIDTLRRLQIDAPGADLSVITGVDAFLDLRRWREPDALLAAAEWIVVSRPGFDLSQLERLDLTAAQRARVHMLGGIAEDISATTVRERLRADLDCTALVPSAVLAYIRQHGLYAVQPSSAGGAAREPLR